MANARQRANVSGAAPTVTGFILAGGRSSRMGQDKALLDWHGSTLLEHMVHLISTVFHPVRIVGRQELPDLVPGCGALGGILTALHASETETAFVTAVDLPLLSREFLQDFRLRLEKSRHRLVACKIGSHFPLCLGLRQELLPEVERRVHSNDLSIHRLIEASDPEIVMDVPERIFQNLNTLADYRKALGEV
jgi:molybdopterin-guanine dinucleotide biosynthesis protein A